jgi:ribosomal protein L6P/L9E
MKVITGDIKVAARKEITKNIKKVVLASLNFNDNGARFTIDMTIQEFVNGYYQHKEKAYKSYIAMHPHEYTNELIKTYASAIDNIIEGVKAYYPFIDLTGIDMSWKIKQIVDIVAKVYFSLPVKTLEDLKKEGIIK